MAKPKENKISIFPPSTLKIKVVGVGKAGNNIISELFKTGVSGAELIAVDTDSQDLRVIKADRKILIGKKGIRGLGCGSSVKMGAEVVHEQSNQIRKMLTGSRLVIICAGMGGGTGTGASPVIAEIAKKVGAVVLSVVTVPFLVEGRSRGDKTAFGIKQLKRYSNTLIILDNNRLLEIAPQLPINTALSVMNKIVSNMIVSNIFQFLLTT